MGVGALKGAKSVRVESFTGVKLSVSARGSIAWGSWQTQLRFGAWLYALQQHVSQAAHADRTFATALKRSGLDLPMHCSEIEADLCFMSRLVQMFENPEGSQLWQSASRGIGCNLPRRLVATLHR